MLYWWSKPLLIFIAIMLIFREIHYLNQLHYLPSQSQRSGYLSTICRVSFNLLDESSFCLEYFPFGKTNFEVSVRLRLRFQILFKEQFRWIAQNLEKKHWLFPFRHSKMQQEMCNITNLNTRIWIPRGAMANIIVKIIFCSVLFLFKCKLRLVCFISSWDEESSLKADP